MYSSQNRVRNIELPENLFSNLGELKSRKIEKDNPIHISPIKENSIKKSPAFRLKAREKWA